MAGLSFTAGAEPTEVSALSQLQSAFEAGGEVKLTDDIDVPTTGNSVDVPVGKTVTLDLNGKHINRQLTARVDGGCVIKVCGKLILKDGSTNQSGSITGGYNDLGGGVYVETGGEFIMQGGVITGNNASDVVGGVYVAENGSFTMSGGKVTDNTAVNCGGGVNVRGGSM